MAKNTAKTTTQPENEAGALEQSANEQSANAPEQETQTVLQAENAALREENATLRAENAALQAARDEVQAATPSMQLEHTHLPQIIEARSADGGEFWRGGVLFNGAWQTVYRAEVGEEAWQRIVNEPRLRIKAADEYGA